MTKQEYRRMFAQKKKEERANKMLSLYYTTHSLMGIPWWVHAFLIGARGRGKSYGAMDTVLSYIKRFGYENVKCYYFRISDLSIKSMLENKGRKAIDAKLIRKYGLEITTHGQTLYDHGHPIIDFYPLVSAAKKGKGIAEYDPDFLSRPNTYIFVIVDEFMIQENLEKKSVGNAFKQYQLYMENILRDQERLDRPAVRCFYCANSVSECSDFITQMCGFIPEEQKRYKLKRKSIIVDNIPNSEAYIDKRKKSYNATIQDLDNDPNYTNRLKQDLETIVPKNKQLHEATQIIKFSKDPRDWFTVWDNNIIKIYSNQTCNNIISMKRYLDHNFNQDLVKDVFDRYDARAFLYKDLMSQSRFKQELKNLKSK